MGRNDPFQGNKERKNQGGNEGIKQYETGKGGVQIETEESNSRKLETRTKHGRKQGEGRSRKEGRTPVAGSEARRDQGRN